MSNQSGQPNIMPVVYVPHGGGPMPLLNEPGHRELIAFLRSVADQMPRPTTILMVTAHWEAEVPTLSSGAAPEMFFDYYGFPPESYAFKYPAPGNPALAERIHGQLAAAGIEARLDSARGYDHGTFVPLLLMYPQADIPVVQLSLINNLSPGDHIALGRALAPLREEGVLIVGSGMSFHNMQAYFSRNATTKPRSQAFDHWLSDTLTSETLGVEEQTRRMTQWLHAPEARFCHPREEHLLPLHVCFGAASVASPAAAKNFTGLLLNTQVSGFIWR